MEDTVSVRQDREAGGGQGAGGAEVTPSRDTESLSTSVTTQRKRSRLPTPLKAHCLKTQQALNAVFGAAQTRTKGKGRELQFTYISSLLLTGEPRRDDRGHARNDRLLVHGVLVPPAPLPLLIREIYGQRRLFRNRLLVQTPARACVSKQEPGVALTRLKAQCKRLETFQAPALLNGKRQPQHQQQQRISGEREN